MFDLEGKVALVTGATSGIGRQQALALSKAGAKVVVLGRRAEQLDETVAFIHESGGEVSALQGALMLDDSLAGIAHRAAEFYGDIDILFNTAGVNLRQHADDVTMESWKSTLDLNLAVPFFLAQQLVPGMRKKGWGRVVNIAALFKDDSTTQRLAASTAFGRNGRLEDLDGVTIFLASSASDYITGQTISVDGGFTAK